MPRQTTMMVNRKDVGTFDADEYQAVQEILPIVNRHGQLIKRGSLEWDAREQRRKALGCHCLSWGPVPLPCGE